MTAPNIEMIASSLRNCSLNYQNNPASPSSSSSSTSSSSSYQPDSTAAPPPPTRSLTGDLTVELNSDVALPFYWEQCLDIRSGQVYYINWEDGTRTSVDPRTREPAIHFYASSSDDEDPETDPEDEEEEVESEAALEVQETYNCDSSSDTDSCSGVNTESSYTSNMSSSHSSFSPTESSSSGGFGALSGASNSCTVNGGGAVLVAAGCKACFMYFMVPKHVNVCPKCGGAGLLHLGRA
ncbi:hypothetical protein LUZ63_005430 [Rhynchospora breviuscula]|uniref:WW domain-containing protein n=1 Tax=Rhynchospora breviuscula TaxID=2022672 RepID=A0A9Q0CN89_9POAL|nr:hypothetical protein LUZ63_005430 [Rhynchospora breviuscula]